MDEPRVEHPWKLTEEDEAVLDEIWASVAYVVQDDLAQVVANEDEVEYRMNTQEERDGRKEGSEAQDQATD